MVQRGWQAHVLGKAEHTFTECVIPLSLCVCLCSSLHTKLTMHALSVLTFSPVTAVTELRKVAPCDIVFHLAHSSLTSICAPSDQGQ
jgi:hypothetical protein